MTQAEEEHESSETVPHRAVHQQTPEEQQDRNVRSSPCCSGDETHMRLEAGYIAAWVLMQQGERQGSFF